MSSILNNLGLSNESIQKMSEQVRQINERHQTIVKHHKDERERIIQSTEPMPLLS